MFEIFENMVVGQSDEIFGVSRISWENSLWSMLEKKSLVRREVFLIYTDSGVMVMIAGALRHVSCSRFTVVSRSILSGKK